MTASVVTLPTAALPINTGKAVLPRKYIMHRNIQHCRNCFHHHEWVQIYASADMLARTGAGKAVAHLTPVDHFEYNLPIDIVSLPAKAVPVCHHCHGLVSLTHLPDPRTSEDWQRSYQLPLRDQDIPIKPAAAKAPARRFTIDDLMS